MEFWAQVLGVTIQVGPVSPYTALGRFEQLSWFVDGLGLPPEQVEELHGYVARFVGAAQRAVQEALED